MEIDQTLQKRIAKDEILKKDFIDNIEKYVGESKGYNAWIMGKLCQDRDIRKKVMENLNTIFLKMTNKCEFAIYMTKEEIRNNISIFFQGDYIKNDILSLFNVLIDDKVYTNDQIVGLLSDNIGSIYNGIGLCGVYDIMEKIPHFPMYKSENPSIQKIDEFLADNIEQIANTKFEKRNFEFRFFFNMERFKNEIGKRGPNFFINFPVDYYTTFDDCKKIADSIFGRFTPENFAKIKYGQHDEKKALVIQTLIEELLEQSGCDLDMENVSKIGNGVYSTVYKVGNYALKIGIGRNNDTIPNHRRLLKPIVRTHIGNGAFNSSSANNTATFIEVQNLIETNWWKNMKEEEVEQVLFNIYSELRNDGLIWMDVKEDNVGRLLKPNTSNVFYLDIDSKREEIQPSEKAIGVEGEESGEILGKGEYVIIDSDYILRYEDWLKIQRSEPGEVCREKKYEERYQAELERKQKESMQGR